MSYASFMPGETGGIPDFLRPRKRLIDTVMERLGGVRHGNDTAGGDISKASMSLQRNPSDTALDNLRQPKDSQFSVFDSTGGDTPNRDIAKSSTAPLLKNPSDTAIDAD